MAPVILCKVNSWHVVFIQSTVVDHEQVANIPYCTLGTWTRLSFLVSIRQQNKLLIDWGNRMRACCSAGTMCISAAPPGYNAAVTFKSRFLLQHSLCSDYSCNTASVLQMGVAWKSHGHAAVASQLQPLQNNDLAKTKTIFRLDALALSVIATATWLAGWLSHSGIVSKPLNLSENFFDHLKAPSL